MKNPLFFLSFLQNKNIFYLKFYSKILISEKLTFNRPQMPRSFPQKGSLEKKLIAFKTIQDFLRIEMPNSKIQISGLANFELLIPILGKMMGRELNHSQRVKIRENYLRFCVNAMTQELSLEQILEKQDSNSQLFLMTLITNKFFNSRSRVRKSEINHHFGKIMVESKGTHNLEIGKFEFILRYKLYFKIFLFAIMNLTKRIMKC